MKLYKIMYKIFIFIIILLIMLYLSIYYFCGYSSSLVGGLIASSVIIVIQSLIGYKIETNRFVYPILKEIYDSSFSLYPYGLCEFEKIQIRYVSDVKENFYKIKKNVLILDKLDTLSSKQRHKISKLKFMIYDLEKELYFIFKTYDEANQKQKTCLYLELHEIMNRHNSDELWKSIVSVSKAFSTDLSDKIIEPDLEDDEILSAVRISTTPGVYLHKLEKKHLDAYEVLTGKINKS